MYSAKIYLDNNDVLFSMFSNSVTPTALLGVNNNQQFLITYGNQLSNPDILIDSTTILCSKLLVVNNFNLLTTPNASPVNGDVWYDGTDINYVVNNITYKLGKLNQLHDVTISSPSNNQLLVYDSATSKWKNSTGLISVSLSDVAISSASEKNLLMYDSTSSTWKNQPKSYINNYKKVFAPTSSPYTVTADSNGFINTSYLLINTGSAYTITLPQAPQQGSRVVIADRTGTAATNNITVNKTGTDTITNNVISTNNAVYAYVYSGSQWTGTSITNILLDQNDANIICDTTTYSYTLYLPASPNIGTQLILKDNGNATTNNVTINGNGVNIDNTSTYVFNSNYSIVTLYYNGQWHSYNAKPSINTCTDCVLTSLASNQVLSYTGSNWVNTNISSLSPPFLQLNSQNITCFNMTAVNAGSYGFRNGVFDGRYLYLSPYYNTAYFGQITRYDTTQTFSNPNAYSFFNTTTVHANSNGFNGGVFDSRYIYFVPYADSYLGQTTRYDTTLPFTNASSYAVFNMTTVHAMSKGFMDAIFDGKYLYFIPCVSAGTYFGQITRYDTTLPFTSTSSYTVYDTTAVNANSKGFSGGVFDGRYLFLVPAYNGAAYSGQITRYDTTASFTTAASYAVFDTTTVHGNSKNFDGGVFDGRYIYFVPSNNGAPHGQITRYDTTASFTSISSYAVFDTTTVDTNSKGFKRGVYDGKYLYLIPNNTGSASGQITRYDTTLSFTSASSYTIYDTSSVNVNSKGFYGGVYDGKHVYLVSYSSGVFTRILANQSLNTNVNTVKPQLSLQYSINDVIISKPKSNNVLSYDGTKWVNSYTNHNMMSDVTFSNMANKDLLQLSLNFTPMFITPSGLLYFTSTPTSLTTFYNSLIFDKICYGNKYVGLIGSTNSVYTSTDGINFTLANSNFFTYVLGVYLNLGENMMWDGTKYLGYGLGTSTAYILYSYDGITWTPTHTAINCVVDIKYNGSVYIAATRNSSFYRSTDGFTWTSITPTGYIVGLVCYNGTTWLATSNTSSWYSIDNGVTWTLITFVNDLGNSGGATCVYSPVLNKYFISTYHNKIASTTDFVTWTFVNTSCARLYIVGNYIISVATNGAGQIYYSTDGTTWTLLAGTTCDFMANIPIIYWKNSQPNTSLLTDLNITTPVDGNLLVYNSSSSKWVNSDTIPDNIFFVKDDTDGTKKLQFQLSGITTGQTRTLTVPDYSGTIAVSTNAQSSNYALISNGVSSSWTAINSSMISDFSFSSLKTNDILMYNLSSGKFYNSSVITGVITTSRKTFGNYPQGSGSDIANNSYYTTSAYADNTDDNILTKYVFIVGNINIQQIVSSYYDGNANASIVSGYKAFWNIGYYALRAYRINVNLGSAYPISQVVDASIGMSNISAINIYGTNVSSEYSDVNTITGLSGNSNLTLLCTYSSQGVTITSNNQTTPFQYIVVNILMSGSWGFSYSVYFKTEGYATSFLVNSATNPSTYGYIIDSDPISGYPRLQNKTGSDLGGTYNRLALLFSEMYRRIYPVIRDKNQIVLTDDTNTVTLTSTSGYPISKASDVTITSIADGNLLIYNSSSSKWINSNTLPDNLLFVKDDLDGTKKMQFQLSGITTGQTRTLTVPDYNGTIVASTNAQINNYTLLSNGTSASWSSLNTSHLTDISTTSITDNQILQYSTTVNIDVSIYLCGTNTGIYFSTDGITWNAIASSPSNVCAIIYGNNKYVAITNTAVVYTSTDYLTWTNVNANLSTIISAIWQVDSIAFDGTKFIVAGTKITYCIATSTDGITWTGCGPNETIGYTVYYTGSIYLAGTNTYTYFYTSSDGFTWTKSMLSISGWAPRFAYNGNTLVLVSGNIQYYSTNNGSSWTQINNGYTEIGYALYSSNLNIFIFITSITTTYYYTSDFITWSSGTFSSSPNATSAININNTLLVSYSTGVMYSTNGTSWSNKSIGTTVLTLRYISFTTTLSINKWKNKTLTSSSISDFSVSSPSNDQVLVYTTASSLNKWTPYTLSGATFNDTNKTITIAGTTALAGLTSDVTITSIADGNLLIYNSSSSKWINSNTLPDNLLFVKDDLDGTKKMQFQLSGITTGQTRTLTVPDASCTIVGDTVSQALTNKTLTDATNNIMAKSLKSATTSIDVSAATAPTTGQVLTATSSTVASWQSLSSSNLSNFSISSPSSTQILQYNGTYWINSYKNVNNVCQATTPTASPFTISKDSNHFVLVKFVFIDTSTEAYTVNLPTTPLQGSTIRISDKTGNASTNNITVVPSGSDTITNDVISTDNRIMSYVYSGTEWTGTSISNMILDISDNFVLCDTSTSAYTLYLPSSPPTGTQITIKDNGNSYVHNITIHGNGANIDGASTAVLCTNFGKLSLLFSVNWFII